MNKMNYINFFNDNGLNLLSTIFANCSNSENILTKIKQDTGLEIKDDMSDDDIQKLKNYESENYQYLTDFLLNNLNTKTNAHRMKLDWFILGFAFLYLPAITFIPLSEMGYRVADTILGVVIGVLIGSVLSYWYDGVSHKN